jgi:hypothetical protein
MGLGASCPRPFVPRLCATQSPDGVDLSRLAIYPSGFGAIGDPSRSSVARGDALMALKIKAAIAQIVARRGSG